MYNPSKAGKKGTIFGLPYTVQESDLIFIPIHLDATVSYKDGTARAPSLILEESTQIDLSLIEIEKPWTLKMAMAKKIVAKSHNEIHRGRAKNVISAIEAGKEVDQNEVNYVNEFCEKVCLEVEKISSTLLDLNKIVAIVGGDHSSPLGLVNALSKKHDFGILQVDAHMDLRESYEGFNYSHASIMFNSLKNERITKLVQVGIRDFSEEEEEYVLTAKDRVSVFYDESIFHSNEAGISWLSQCIDIVDLLPNKVYISLDVDGLEPSLCPNTGTPVPGGLSFNKVLLLISEVVRSGRTIIGFDVCETGNHFWDANVASRILYRLASYAGVSNGLLKFR